MISRNDTWSIKGSFSKGLGHSKMVLGFEVDVSLASASSMRDNLVMPYRQTHSGIKPYFKGSIMRWLSLNYEAEYGVSKLTLNNENNMYHTLHQNLFATIIPIDDIQFTFGAEHFLTRFPEGSLSNLILLDASANWRINSKIRLSITASNLLNKRCYMYVNYGTLSRSEHSFTIRPRSIMASIQYQF
ncbi:MAG: TonB-dependent receptor [Muribaculaceae bacterium]|nr:TonB-dependent receptor [Muribaculaceae bacterium]